MNFTEKVKSFLEIKGINQKELAKKIGKAENLVSRWINADKPSMEFILTMIKFYPDFDVNYVLKEKKAYSDLENNSYSVNEKSNDYGKSAEDIIEEIESKLTLLKEKVAQNSHK